MRLTTYEEEIMDSIDKIEKKFITTVNKHFDFDVGSKLTGKRLRITPKFNELNLEVAIEETLKKMNLSRPRILELNAGTTYARDSDHYGGPWISRLVKSRFQEAEVIATDKLHNHVKITRNVVYQEQHYKKLQTFLKVINHTYRLNESISIMPKTLINDECDPSIKASEVQGSKCQITDMDAYNKGIEVYIRPLIDQEIEKEFGISFLGGVDTKNISSYVKGPFNIIFSRHPGKSAWSAIEDSLDQIKELLAPGGIFLVSGETKKGTYLDAKVYLKKKI